MVDRDGNHRGLVADVEYGRNDGRVPSTVAPTSSGSRDRYRRLENVRLFVEVAYVSEYDPRTDRHNIYEISPHLRDLLYYDCN